MAESLQAVFVQALAPMSTLFEDITTRGPQNLTA